VLAGLVTLPPSRIFFVVASIHAQIRIRQILDFCTVVVTAIVPRTIGMSGN
jgi:hypothetical protein